MLYYCQLRDEIAFEVEDANLKGGSFMKTCMSEFIRTKVLSIVNIHALEAIISS